MYMAVHVNESLLRGVSPGRRPCGGYHWGMSRCATASYKRIASLLAEKTADPYSDVRANLRCRMSFALLRASVMCLRGARSTYTVHLTADPVSAEVVVAEAGVARF